MEGRKIRTSDITSAPFKDDTGQDAGNEKQKSILRFMTCGSVDDGKSTLIGRLLYDTKLVFNDTLQDLAQDSKVFGTTEGNLDFALLVDGLQAEREQGITIDVAYRYFSTPNRSFIVADTPGHEQYTRNMATGASHCDLAVILIDARNGIVKQTRRHTYIVNLLGIKHIVLAVNKIDLIDYDQKRYEDIVQSYVKFTKELGVPHVSAIPVSALEGTNLVSRSDQTPWYDGPSLLELLEEVEIDANASSQDPLMPVQWVCRPNLDFRGYAGTLVSGKLRKGDPITVAPSGHSAVISRIVTPSGDVEEATSGDALVLTLDSEIDVARGDVICCPTKRPEVADQFAAHIVWMSTNPMLIGRPYRLNIGTQSTHARISDIKYRVGMKTLEHLASRKLELNDIAFCNITTSKPLVITPYQTNRALGGFILIDRTTNETVCAGMIQFGLRRSHNVHWQALSLSKQQRAIFKGHKGCCLWFTGLSGSGKSTVANQVEKRLFDQGAHTYILDGDNVRHGLCRDLGFTDADRVENIRRVAEVAKLMVDAGLIAVVSFISPFRAERQFARELFAEDEFIEVFIDTPIEVCESRDPKGLYQKARAGELANFTGISSPYEAPLNPECHLNGHLEPPETLAEQVLSSLRKRGVV